MTDELVKRIDARARQGIAGTPFNLLMDAKERIEALTAERDCYRKAQAENDNAWAALWAILACETPNANATVTRMAHLARVCLKGENHE